ncbi:MAG TPA: hypothetical protein G4O06_02835 [Dehalococcoidia bacterium]|nr:hypothetical protein [Dehalococcoidia bacterium]
MKLSSQTANEDIGTTTRPTAGRAGSDGREEGPDVQASRTGCQREPRDAVHSPSQGSTAAS